jgi:drug/metabolite transporter (DMT)-like permease
MTLAAAYRGERSAFLAWVAICVIWGATYLAIKIALEGIPPFLIGASRFLLAGSIMLAVLKVRGEALPPRESWGRLALSGALLLGGGNGGVVVAEQWIASGLAAVVIATSPFWMVGIEAFHAGGERISRRQSAGLLVGFLGIVLLVWPGIASGGAGGWRFVAGVLSLQAACASWALGSSISRRVPARVSPMQTAAMQMLFGGAVMLLMGTLLGEWGDLAPTWRSSLAVLYLTFVGGLGGFGAYIYALSRLPVSFVSLYAYVNPVIAVLLGTWLLGEPFGLRIAIAMAVVLAGMGLVSSSKQSRTGPESSRRRRDEEVVAEA